MYAIYVGLFIASIIGYGILESKTSEPDHSLHRAESLATNQAYYAGAVKAYVIANPTTTGTVTQASLNLPAWFNNMGWTNNVTAAGVITVYPTNLTVLGDNTQISRQLLELTQGGQTVGINRNGTFFNPVSGNNTSIAIPAAVPNNAPVYVLTTR